MRVKTVTALALVVLLSGCGGGGATATSGTSTTTPPTSSTTTSSAAPTSSSAPAVKPSYKAELTIQQAGLGLLTLTNSGTEPVTVQGWVRLTWLSANGKALQVPSRNVKIPGEGPAIPLKPGTTAFAGVKWEVGDKADASAYVATGLQLTTPSGAATLPVTLVGTDGKPATNYQLVAKSAQIGSLQPSSQGVVAF
ncbi:DUF4232 domain-containing protein [Kutzneria albida]|nr:DUF4232 domain-containing protein [Kutzneria albida]